jgi:transcriptional regulator with XRE-family HTH domain
VLALLVASVNLLEVGFSPVESWVRNMAGFRQRITRERNKRNWSQAEVAKRLTAMGIDNVHLSTVSKIEGGDRDIKLDEAAAMAELYGVSLDALLGRKPKNQREVRYLLDALTDAVFLSRTELHRAAKTLQDRLDDVPSDYQRHGTLAGLVHEVLRHLDAAGTALDELVDESIQDIEQRAVERVVKQLKSQPADREPQA